MIKRILYLFIALLFLPQISFAEVDRFVFTTEPQTIKPNELSGSITIQAQNNSSSQENVAETIDMVFTSSSNTGEFLNSSGGVVSKTMSKNTANRTFYYKDSKEGEFLITVSLTGRDSQKSFSASQKINISSTGQTQTTNQNSGSNTSGNTTTTSTNTEYESSHSSPAPTTGSKDILDFEISAGRDRFSSVGGEIIFQAVPIKLNGLSASNINYVWNLGDGTKKEGNIISHKYRFAGEYNVVLNGSFSDKSAVSRIKVLVIDPKLEISLQDYNVAISNRSSGEINLGDFILESGVYRFVFPKDTIIGKDKKIIIGRDLFNIFENKIILKNPLLTEIYRFEKNIATSTLLVNLDISTTTSIVEEKNNNIKISDPIKKTAMVSTQFKKEDNIKPETGSTTIYIAKKDANKLSRIIYFFKGIFR